jgi:Caspase domain
MCALSLRTKSRFRASQSHESQVTVCYATHSGGTTIDCDSKGGNPFATAFIEFSSLPDVKIADFATFLSELTTKISHGHQLPEWVGVDPTLDWRLPQPSIGKKSRRAALVLIVSDYSFSGSANLDGAAWDELRISEMLARNGFSVTQGIGSSHKEILFALETFAEVSRDSDIAIVYSTGHGCEADGQVYLIPGDFPIKNGFKTTELVRSAVTVARLTEVCSARSMNLVFFAGCRTTYFSG